MSAKRVNATSATKATTEDANTTTPTIDCGELDDRRVTIVSYLSARKFDVQIAQRPEHLTRVKTRVAHSPRVSPRSRKHDVEPPGEGETEWLYALLDGSTVLGYLEYTRDEGSRIYLNWIASWGREHTVPGVAGMLLGELIARCAQHEVGNCYRLINFYSYG